ncbi:PilC/PilY family type IV pilus protein [Thauera aminoaromatica]|nr:PilC/PilY family type IV pilus protein [Thauera aminoaromatica]
MKSTTFMPSLRKAALVLAGVAATAMTTGVAAAPTPLADQPISIADVPANVMLALSVEFPTAITRAHQDGFDTTKKYLGYFDSKKCYIYDESKKYFQPAGFTGTNYTCSGQWSGNFMNWATMQGIDTFRWVLTGGLRVVDEPKQFAGASGSPLGKTILERAYASKQGNYLSSNFPDRFLDGKLVTSYTGLPAEFKDRTLWIRNGGMGVQVLFGYETSDEAPWSRNSEDWKREKQIAPPYNVNVEVCRDQGSGASSYLETNCRKYVDSTGTKTVWKPAGLMQQYKDKMYFGAFGYLYLPENTSANVARDGGVLRAQMQSLDNEISETGAFPDDPYNMQATQAVNSGTINYLNKFGQRSGKYKYYDPVSELYAEAVKYFKAMKPTASYVAGVDATLRDGFPVFTDWNDPATDAKYPTQGALSCKKNYIIGIGDTNSNYDRNLSGAHSPIPQDVDSNMAGKTARAWTDTLGSLEGIGTSLGTDKVTSGGTENGYLIAGIAYYAHSTDIRPDISGNQTVETYWMDVLEDGYAHKNQYWLAAKYGGYKKPNRKAPPSAFNSSTDIWGGTDVKKTGIRYYNGFELPNNYYPASKPDDMLAGLQNAFMSIAEGSGAAAGSGLSSLQLSETTGGSNTYQGTYDAGTWSGDVIASKINKIVNDQPDLTQLWSAATRLASIGSDNRVIVTMSPADKAKTNPTPSELKGTPFRWDYLSTTQQFNLSVSSATPAGDSTEGKNILNYLRGDRSNETTVTTAKAYRLRTNLLGDIVDSKVTYLGKPNASYSDTHNPGYTTFKTNKANRTPLVLVGANDGMLHAFDASEGSNAGNEVFAVIPYSTFEGPDRTPQTSGLQALARHTYTHHYYMNATPEIRDVDFARTGNSLSAISASTPADWRTLLVTGQGKGGRSFIAVDVTDITPGALNETSMAGKVLWEFSHADMGFSYGRPLIAKTRRWGWVVILTSGYNNTSGKGALFVLNAKTGELLKGPIQTSAGSATTPAGLAQIEGYTEGYADYTLRYVYGGDLLGNVWRFDFTDVTKDPVALKIGEVKSPDGTPQPITTAPKIEYSAKDLKRYVFVGTGRLLSLEDQGNSQQQTLYAFRDGTKSRAYGTESYETPLPTGTSFPITRAKMSAVTNLLAGATADNATPMGWYYDLTGRFTSAGKQAVTERIVLNLQANDGVVTWGGSILNDDPCNASGTTRLYSAYYGSGQSVLTTIVGGQRSRIEWLDLSPGLADVSLVRIGSRIGALGTDVSGGSKIYGSTLAESGEPRVTNWRVIHE